MKLAERAVLLLTSRNLVVVVLLAALIVLFAIDPDNDLPPGAVPRPFDTTAGVLITGATLMLSGSRRWPLRVLAGVLACNYFWHFLGYGSGLINLPTFVALFAVGVTGDRTRQAVALASGTVPTTIVIVFVENSPWRATLDAVGWTVVAVLLGEIVHSRQELLHSYRQRAEQAEADREAEAQRRVATERLRIAQDLHDLLGHTVSLMMVQAGVAADALPHRPEQAGQAIADLRRTGRQATAEVRATVELLRQHQAPELAPSPTTAELEALVGMVRQLGIDVETAISPGIADLTPLLQLTIYRVVQEALTNVTRHAGAAKVHVAIEQVSGTVTVTVDDDGGGADDNYQPGHGLTGMRERVALAGGTLTHGTAPGGGFLVAARLPIERAGVR